MKILTKQNRKKKFNEIFTYNSYEVKCHKSNDTEKATYCDHF